MTYQPPPSGQQPPYGGQPPQGQPTYGAPPPQPAPGGQPGGPWTAPPPPHASGPQWGSPSGGGQNPLAGFNASSVNPLDWGILAAGLLAFIFSFFSYYSLSGYHEGPNFFGWLGVLLALAGAVITAVALFAPQVRMPVSPRLISLAAFGLATLLVLLSLLFRPTYGGCFGTFCNHVTLHVGVGLILVLIAVVIGTALSFLRFQQAGGQLPSGMGHQRRGAPPQLGQYGPPPGGPGQYGPPPPAGPGQYGPPPGGPGQYGPPPQH
jgi:uncharacterized membrane protein